MNYSEVSESSLLALYDRIRTSRAEGEVATPDWKQQADSLAAEMNERGIKFTPIQWKVTTG